MIRSVLWFVLGWMVTQSISGQQLFTKQYSTAEGLAQNQVFSIEQDARGFMWFGTAGGLSRYDGRSWKSYTKENGMPSSVVRALKFDREGRLWIGTDEGITCYLTSQDSFVNYDAQIGPTQSIGGGIVRAIIEDGQNRLWFATGTGLTLLDSSRKSWRNLTTSDGLLSDVVLSLETDSGNSIYAGTQHGICKIQLDRENDTPRVESWTTLNGLINNRIEAIFSDPAGILWIGTPVGISRMADGRISNFTATHGLPHSSIRSFYRGSRGYLWIATDGGVSRTNPAVLPLTFTNYSILNGLPSNQVYTIMEDRENNFWFGSFGKGVTKLLSEELVSYRSVHGLPSDAVLSLASIPSKEIFVGTTNGLALLTPNSGMQTYSTEQGLTHTEIWDVLVDSSGLVWLGTYNDIQILVPAGHLAFPHNTSPGHATKIEGLLKQSRRIKDFYSVNLYNYPDLSGHRVVDIQQDSRGRIWFAATDAGVGCVTIDRNGAIGVKMYTTREGLPSNNPWCIREDHTGRIWIGFIGSGLGWMDEANKKFVHLDELNGIPDRVSLALCEDDAGLMWVGSEQGMYAFPIEAVLSKLIENPDSRLDTLIHVYSKKNGLNDNSVNAILQVRSGELWVGTNNGLHLFDTRTRRVIKMYSKKQGLADNEISTHNSLIQSDGTLWAGTVGGLTAIPLNGGTFSEIPAPNVFVTRFSVEDYNLHTVRNLDLNRLRLRPPELEFDENNVTFEFVAPSFKDETDVRYRYRLSGFDKEWSEILTTNTVRYTNLNDGSYRFEVIAANGLGQWSETPAVAVFTIKTPFWKSWWFILFSTCFLGLTIYTVYQFRISLVHQRTAELEEKVLKRTKELIVQKETVERILSELKETQTQLVHSEKMASLGQMVAGIAHEINNPITFIKANLSLLQKQVAGVQSVFYQFSELFEFYEKFKDHQDEDHRSFRARLEALDQKIEATKFERFLNDFPTVIKEMNEGVDRTHKIVDDLRNFSRLDESHFKEISIHDCIESTLNILKNEYKTRVKIHRNYGELPKVYCNPGHINQVLMNLFVNAFQAIEGEGDVFVRTSAGTNNILVAIRDNGKGIPEEIKNKVYDPFFTTKPIGKGTGLGLAISYKILEAHKGTIYFDSTPGKGTEFKITLPIRRTTDPAATKLPAA
ncbi:MAG: hypothetical protein KDC45_01545 [Bacteroidetes bacterium]|nr:hypothetical protein [Bacteroidota bacterium]